VGGELEWGLAFVAEERSRLTAPVAADHVRVAEMRIGPEDTHGHLFLIGDQIIAAKYLSCCRSNDLSAQEGLQSSISMQISRRSALIRGMLLACSARHEQRKQGKRRQSGRKPRTRSSSRPIASPAATTFGQRPTAPEAAGKERSVELHPRRSAGRAARTNETVPETGEVTSSADESICDPTE